MSGARTISRFTGLAKRTVHIKISPTPRTFPERREVLRVLEQFGEVSMFRSLKYNTKAPISNAFISLFTTEAGAAAALDQSPIVYRLMTSVPQSEASPTESGLGSALAVPDHAPAEPSAIESSDEKTFELHISTSTFNHGNYITSPTTNPLHGPFIPINPTRSYISASLDSVIPPSMWAPGLKDWETDSTNIRAGKMADSEANPGQSVPVTSIEWRVNQRQRKRRETSLPKVMMGLKNLRREWEAEQKTKAEKPVESAVS